MQRARISTTAIGTLALIAGSAIPALANDDNDSAVEYHDWTLETIHEPAGAQPISGLQTTPGTTDTFVVSGPEGDFVFTVRQAQQALDEPVSLRAFGDLGVLHRQAERERELARITAE